MISGIGIGELLVILFIVLLIFGAKRIPELARSLRRGVEEFKDAGKEEARGVKGAKGSDSGNGNQA